MSCALVVAIIIVAVGVVIWQSEPREVAESDRPGEDKIYISATKVLLALVLIGAAAIVFAAVISWLISRRAVRPLGQAL